jgi:hypothetical protein
VGKYKIGGKELDLFTIKNVSKLFGYTTEAIRQKEHRGTIPPAFFKSPSGFRLYSAEEIAFLEYLFRDILPTGRGYPTPQWAKDLAWEGFKLIRDEVMDKGSVESEATFTPLYKKYKLFSPYRLLMYIKHWRYILLDEEEEKDILDWVDEEY